MNFDENDFVEFFHMYGEGKGAIQELCVQLCQLHERLLDYEQLKERVYELEMRAGMHATDYRQIDLF